MDHLSKVCSESEFLTPILKVRISNETPSMTGLLVQPPFEKDFTKGKQHHII